MIENTPPDSSNALEMWGGVECSVVRVNGESRDQLRRSGHWTRIEDLDAFAALGLRALRYPVLWEHHASDPIDWGWADERLARLRELGIRPIIGLIHHGCGPLPGGLLDPGFVNGLDAFARQVAERYPWVDAYTPVNEPATTARFGGLYGLWHPHGRDVCCFGECFLAECLGTRAAMKAIREVNPRAQLVQTEDVGKVHSTPHLAYQAEYENERRWITFDVLCGHVDRDHPVHAHLLQCGVSLRALESFVEDPCPPDVMGMNHYVTSERFLDENLERYPRCTHGGNGRDRYADLDAVRVRAEGLVGIKALLTELWQRYHRPIAITEVQLACTREEQVRWLVEAWNEASAARREGVDVRAITPWALLGSFDWDSLLVENRGNYENGAYDVRGPRPRPTALATAIAELAAHGRVRHPGVDGPGWWRRPLRLEYAPVSAPRTGAGRALPCEPALNEPPIAIVGAQTTLGRAFLRLCEMRGLCAVGVRRGQLDLMNRDAVVGALGELRPWAIIHCPGHVGVGRPEANRGGSLADNAVAAGHLAAAAQALGARYVAFSSALVFDGRAARPYVEGDLPHPVTDHGQAQHQAEKQIAAQAPDALIVRTGALFSPWDESDFAARTLRALSTGQRVLAPENLVSPTYVPDLVNAVLDLLIDRESGLWHLANQGSTSWYAWALTLADLMQLPRERVVAAADTTAGGIAAYPGNTALETERGALLAPWRDALERYPAATPIARDLVAA